MRRVGGLFDRFSSWTNLWRAYRMARQGTRRSRSGAAFFFHLDQELLQLQDELLTGSYRPGPLRQFTLHDPKERVISVALFRDRVVHHALVSVLEPIFERVFIHDSYATRKGKGTHKALLRAQDFLRQARWFLKSDIKSYFPSIDHQTLVELVARKVKDRRLMEVVEHVVGWGGRLDKGLPIGNLTSQFLANVYLDPFDHFVKRSAHHGRYLRYMDDFVLFAPEKSRLKDDLPRLRDFLADKLKLAIKEEATYINQAANGLSFLGARVFTHALRVKPECLRRSLARIRDKERLWRIGLLPEPRFLDTMNGHWQHLQNLDSLALRRLFLNGVDAGR